MKKPFFIVIAGPTAVGKSDIAVSIAQNIGGEIINGDSGQCYQPLTIGTAKPDWKNQPVPHHLFDIFSTPEHFTASHFHDRVATIMHEIWQRNRIPIVVGGSGFYIKSLFFPPQANVDDERVPDVEIDFDEKNLWQQLFSIDPERAKKIHPHDVYRIKRALTIWQQTGKMPSSYVPEYQPLASYSCLVFNRDRQELYTRIEERVIQMIDSGFIEEAKKLFGTEWEPFLKKKKIIGYDVIFDYVRAGNLEKKKDEMIALIVQKTRNYAKRQLIFLRSFEKQLARAIAQQSNLTALPMQELAVVDLTLLDLDLYIKHQSEKFSNHLTMFVDV